MCICYVGLLFGFDLNSVATSCVCFGFGFLWFVLRVFCCATGNFGLSGCFCICGFTFTLVLVWIATYFCLISGLFCWSLSFWVSVCITYWFVVLLIVL